MKKPLSKKEIKARQAEANVKKAKKRDFRKFANDMFKNPTDHLPLKIGGFGEGTNTYCYDCRSYIGRTRIKEKGIAICGCCSGNSIEFRKKFPNLLLKTYWQLKQLKYDFRQHKK